jgi:hypothetical protein
MHSALTQDLASQHSAQLQAAAAMRCRRAAVASAARAGNVTEEPAHSMTQRAGWALVQVGLRLALHQPG